MKSLQIITISRQVESSGNLIAKNLAQRLGFKLIDHDYVLENWLAEVANDHQLHMLKQSSKFYNKVIDKNAENEITFAEYISNKLQEVAKTENIVILCLGSQIIFRDNPRAIHIKIVASKEKRIQKTCKKYGLNYEQAERTIDLSDRKHRRYLWRIYEADWLDPTLYHVSINSDGFKVEEAVELLITLIDQKKENLEPLNKKVEDFEKDNDREGHNFAHSSEKEFAKILDMHHINWKYEPTEFPLEWDAEGNVTMGIRPDFYLIDYNTYIELTTMKRKYVTEKNKKIRLLRKKYPDINVKIVYKKDFHKLVEKFDFNKGEEKDEG
uniref:Cytidylate kinase n=1 Tax=uncultured organism TaxID=155900 RepID=M1QBT0_9ZZZZ|nr:cytidylate kinase [uncultured organism]